MEIIDILFLFLFGMIATSIMSIENFLVLRKWGLMGVLELHESQAMVDRLFRRPIKEKITRLGIFIHLINGGLLALPIIFLIPLLKHIISLFILCILYSILVWLITLAPVHKSLTGISLRNHPHGKLPILFSIVGHLIYGVVLGILIQLI